MNRKQILDYFAETNTTYIHSNGKNGTAVLINQLDCKVGENILEIGTGTGATIVKLASRYKATRFYGLEISELMLRKTNLRIKFCGLKKRILMRLAENPTHLPFESNYFDKIYAESVLGIQEDEKLETLVTEINRILKPGGKLYLNETIWIDSISSEEIYSINNFCKKEFGIIQSNGKYKYKQHWVNLLVENNFNLLKIEQIDDLISISKWKFPNRYEVLSNFYTLLGKLKGKIKSSLKIEYLGYKNSMEKVFKDKKYLVGLFIITIKKV